MEWIFLVLIGLVLLFGIGVLLVSRMRAQRTESLPPAPPRTPPTAPPRAPSGAATAVLEPEVLEPEVPEIPAVVEPEVVAPVTLRERMARARNALAGAFTGVRG